MDDLGTAATRALAAPERYGKSSAVALPGPTRERLPSVIDVYTDMTIPRRTLSNWLPSSGPRPLRRALTDDERAAVHGRERALDAALQPFGEPDRDRVADALLGLLNSYLVTSRMGEAESAARVDGAMEVLADLPAWAIEEACLRIRRHGYHVTDPGAYRARLEQRYAPNDAQIYAEAAEAARVRKERRDAARELLTAPVEEDRPEDRNVRAMVGEVKDAIAVSAAEQENQIREHMFGLLAQREIEQRRQEYRRAGLPVPQGDIFPSLALMLAEGYRIESRAGEAVLVR